MTHLQGAKMDKKHQQFFLTIGKAYHVKELGSNLQIFAFIAWFKI